jgi:hypothetical protein
MEFLHLLLESRADIGDTPWLLKKSLVCRARGRQDTTSLRYIEEWVDALERDRRRVLARRVLVAISASSRTASGRALLRPAQRGVDDPRARSAIRLVVAAVGVCLEDA